MAQRGGGGSAHRVGGSGKPVKSTAVNTGRNAELAPLRDDRWVKCAKCGFVNHLDRSMRAPRYSPVGTGVTFVGYGSGAWGSSAWGGSDPTVTAGNGCSFCGTYLYAG
jgi:hypothetical protein